MKINEIVAVCIENKTVSNEGVKFQHLEMVALSATAFSIHVVRRITRHRWRTRKVTFHSKDSSVIQQWVEKIQEILSKAGRLTSEPSIHAEKIKQTQQQENKIN